MFKERLNDRLPGDTRRSPRRWLRRYGAALLATASLLPLNDYTDVRLDPSAYVMPVPFDMNPGSPVEHSVTNTCDNPSDSDVAAVENLFDQPQNPEITEIFNTRGDQDYIALFTKVRKNVAEKYGLTVYDFNEEYPEFREDQDRDDGPELSFSEYFIKTKQFAEKYGVNITLKDPNAPQGSYGSVGYRSEELENRSIKSNMYELARALSEVPVEFVTYMGIKNVVITKFDPKSGVAGYADIVDGHTMYVDPVGSPLDIFYHEGTHLWDSQKCGVKGMYGDGRYTMSNPLERVYKISDKKQAPAVASSQYIDQHAFEEFKYGIQDEMRLAAARNDQYSIKELQRELRQRGLSVAAIDMYAFTNEVEDKASTGGSAFNMFDQRYALDPRTPRVRAKTELLFARMYEDHPKLVSYFSEIGMRAN